MFLPWKLLNVCAAHKLCRNEEALQEEDDRSSPQKMVLVSFLLVSSFSSSSSSSSSQRIFFFFYSMRKGNRDCVALDTSAIFDRPHFKESKITMPACAREEQTTPLAPTVMNMLERNRIGWN